MPSPIHRYCSYLMRLWWVESDGESHWRVALESTQDGQRWTFADLDAMLLFLKAQAGAPGLPQGEVHA